jgi:Excalibur calcium-binding domain
MRRTGIWLASVVLGATLCAVSSGSIANAASNPWPHAVVNGFSNPTGTGFWLAYGDGSVSANGSAHLYGDASGLALNGPIVGGAVAPSSTGYWLVATDGGIFTYGSARFHGSMGGARLNQPVFSMAPTKSGAGYWLVARDGGIFAFNAPFYGSTGSLTLNQPINGIGTSPTGKGYRMVARDGGIFSFGDVPFYGSLPGRGLNVADVVGTAATPTNKGYWIARTGGQVYAFGDAHNFGNYTPSACDPVSAIFSNPKAQGYRLVTASGATIAFGAAPGGSGATGTPRQCPSTTPPNPGDTKNCSDFATWADANAWFQTYFPYYGDVARLDEDGNGIPCQSLPGAP